VSLFFWDRLRDLVVSQHDRCIAIGADRQFHRPLSTTCSLPEAGNRTTLKAVAAPFVLLDDKAARPPRCHSLIAQTRETAYSATRASYSASMLLIATSTTVSMFSSLEVTTEFMSVAPRSRKPSSATEVETRRAHELAHSRLRSPSQAHCLPVLPRSERWHSTPNLSGLCTLQPIVCGWLIQAQARRSGGGCPSPSSSTATSR
jgi:hypothetical protein